jgi:ABC-type multidrug transport system permease subunit
MARRPSPLENLGRLVWLDFLWNLRVPQSVFYQFFVAGILLVLLYQINGSPDYLDVLVPGLIGLLAASNAMQGIGATVSYMRAYGAWRTLRGSPIPTALYLGGLVAGRVVRVLMTVVFILVLARILFGYRFPGSVLLACAWVVLGVAVFAALGLVVTYSVKTPQAVTSVLNMIFLFMLFASNTLFIAEVDWLRAVSWVSPLTYLSDLLRETARGGLTGGGLARVAALVAWFVVLSTVALRLAQKKVEEV